MSITGKAEVDGREAADDVREDEDALSASSGVPAGESCSGVSDLLDNCLGNTHLWGLLLRRSVLSPESLAAGLLPAHILESRSPLAERLWSLCLPLGPVVGPLGARVPYGWEEVVCIVVAGDLGTGRVDRGEHQGIEVGVPSLETMFRHGEVRRGEEVEQGEVGHAEIDALEVAVHGVDDERKEEPSGTLGG